MNWRKELQVEFGDRVGWLVRNDRKTAAIGLIKLVNAVWFSGLWQTGFAVSLPLFIWLGFFVASMLLAFRLDKSRFNQKGDE
ncbi:MAG: hypothetical protein B7Z83_11125 [Thiomonas sp. 20-64-5]|nr:MAG: hypothetical protein B7Z83_11125 [Thiomonas sp. 20-64-5]OYV51618.1 MAG: hypothetical protein B7X10_00600 [Burkholderiales bacterium 21-58-4]